MGRCFTFASRWPVTNLREAIKSTDGLGLKSGPIDFAVITPRIDLRPGNIGSPALAFGSASFGGHKRVLKYEVDHQSQPSNYKHFIFHRASERQYFLRLIAHRPSTS
jgi:hypothetical protein